MRLFGMLLGLALLAAVPARAAWPDRPVTALLPFAPGGGVDGVTRVISDQLSRQLGQPVVIENRGGANGSIGAAAAARARPDGHTLFFTTGSTQVINPVLFRSLPYDPAKDFVPVARIGVFPLMLIVHPSLPAQNIQELIALLRSRPGAYSFGHWSAVYLSAGKAFARGIGAEVLDVPYRASAATMTDLVAGRISFAVQDLTVGLPLARGGEVRPLATTGARRSALLPELPTLQEAGLPGYDISAWMGVYAPAGTPPEVVDAASRAILHTLAQPAVVERLANLGFEPIPGDAAELAQHQAREALRWRELIASLGISAE